MEPLPISLLGSGRACPNRCWPPIKAWFAHLLRIPRDFPGLHRTATASLKLLQLFQSYSENNFDNTATKIQIFKNGKLSDSQIFTISVSSVSSPAASFEGALLSDGEGEARPQFQGSAVREIWACTNSSYTWRMCKLVETFGSKCKSAWQEVKIKWHKISTLSLYDFFSRVLLLCENIYQFA